MKVMKASECTEIEELMNMTDRVAYKKLERKFNNYDQDV